MDGAENGEGPGVAPTVDRLDVLYLTHNYPRHDSDFAGRFIARLARLVSAHEAGWRVGVLAPHHPGASLHETLDGIKVWRFRYAADDAECLAYRGDWHGATLLGPYGLPAHGRFFAAFRRDARRLMARMQPRVVHAHWWVPAGWVACAVRTPLVVTLHGSDWRLLESKPWMRPLASRVFRRAGIITTVSTWLADSLRAMFPGIAGKIRVAPMPPDEALFTATETAPGGNDPPVLLSVTRFTTQKRNQVLLEALAQLRGRGRGFRCRLVGDGGAEREKTERLVRDLGLSDCVEFVGALSAEDVAGEYRRADLMVLASVHEGFGMALVEAQLCGCPVVAVRSGGMTDIVEDGVTGFLAAPDDSTDLAEVLDRTLADADRRRRVAGQGMESARRNFSAAAVTARFVEWYEGLT